MEEARRVEDGRAAEVLRYLADMYDEEPMSVGLLLLRLRYSGRSLRWLSRKLGITAVAGNRLWHSLERYSPALAGFARGQGTKAHGLQGGRKKQGER